MVKLFKRQRKKGMSYCVQWQDPITYRTRTETFRDKALALDVAARRRREFKEGRAVGIKTVSYDDFVSVHLADINSQLSTGSYTEHKRALEQFKQACRPNRLTDIDFDMLARFRTARQQDGISPATVNKCLRTLQAALERAVKRNYIKVNPFIGNRRALWADELEPEIYIISPDEFKALLDYCPDDKWRAIVTIAYYGGLRRGEILALRWSDIDYINGMIQVVNTESHKTKSRKIRKVPMTTQVIATLGKLGIMSLKTGLIFRNADGGPLFHNISRSLENIMYRAGLVDTQGKCLFTLHDLRRTCATEMLRSGVSPKTVQRILGHANLTTTMRYYVGVEDKDLIDAARRREQVG